MAAAVSIAMRMFISRIEGSPTPHLVRIGPVMLVPMSLAMGMAFVTDKNGGAANAIVRDRRMPVSMRYVKGALAGVAIGMIVVAGHAGTRIAGRKVIMVAMVRGVGLRIKSLGLRYRTRNRSPADPSFTFRGRSGDAICRAV